MMELKEWVHTPYHGKQYADSTLRGMKKEELIQIIRDYEHNYNALYEANERGIRAATKMLCKTDNVAEKPRWIPVTERLPKCEERVLVFGGFTMYVAYYGENRYGGKSWHKLNSKSHYCNPTHWMPLPEPPLEEGPAKPYDLLYEEGGVNTQ